ncbi:MAG TPA: hypothetical protein VFV38_28065 [Ktedonobacteraceae bacterium]|nr:hypothetical protein [Ktedonobacteraceae bacterium]
MARWGQQAQLRLLPETSEPASLDVINREGSGECSVRRQWNRRSSF